MTMHHGMQQMTTMILADNAGLAWIFLYVYTVYCFYLFNLNPETQSSTDDRTWMLCSI